MESSIRYHSTRSSWFLLELFQTNLGICIILQAKKKLAIRQDDDPESRKNLDLKMKNVVVNKKALESTDSHVSRNVPPYDASATTPQEAYVLDKIILKGEWDYLEDIYNILQQGEEADFSAYPTFICNRIQRLKKIKVFIHYSLFAWKCTFRVPNYWSFGGVWVEFFEMLRQLNFSTSIIKEYILSWTF